MAKAGPKQEATTTTNAYSISDFFKNKIEPVLQAIQAGNVVITDPNCYSPSYSLYSNLLTTTVSGQNFYVVLNPTSVNGRGYNSSYCQQRSLSNGSYEIECAATEQSPVVTPGRTLSFLIEFMQTGASPNSYTISKCPQSGQ